MRISDWSSDVCSSDLDYLGKENSQIVEMKIDEPTITLTASEETKTFQVRVFKFYATRAARSKVSLVAHRREVTDNHLQYKSTEFSEDVLDQLGRTTCKERVGHYE